MDDNLRNKWLSGVLVPCVALVWGVSSLVSREIIIPIRRFQSLPIFAHIPVHGWPAMLISLALISLGVCMHFGFFWSRYPKWERLASGVSVCTAWTAGILFSIGIFAWSMRALVDF